ncbi:hypothetical protein JCM11641_004901 [Rhodosporidiobolus odoratus]
MSVASNSLSNPPTSYPPSLPSLAAVPPAPSTYAQASPPSFGSPASQAIPLRRGDFPLLHSLLESPAYREALEKNPELTRRPSARRSNAQKPHKRQASKSKPPKSNSGGGVSELWSRVPKALGTGSSVGGSDAAKSTTERPRKAREDKWEIVPRNEDIATVRDGLLGFPTPGPPAISKKEKASSSASNAALSRRLSRASLDTLQDGLLGVAPMPQPPQSKRTKPPLPRPPVVKSPSRASFDSVREGMPGFAFGTLSKEKPPPAPRTPRARASVDALQDGLLGLTLAAFPQGSSARSPQSLLPAQKATQQVGNRSTASLPLQNPYETSAFHPRRLPSVPTQPYAVPQLPLIPPVSPFPPTPAQQPLSPYPSPPTAAPPSLAPAPTLGPPTALAPVLAAGPASSAAPVLMPEQAATAVPPPPKLSGPLYPSRSTEGKALHMSTSASSEKEKRSGTSGFQSAVSQLKRMLTRDSRKGRRRPSRGSKSPSSLGAESIFSTSTQFVGDGDRSRTTSMLSTYSPSTPFVELAAEEIVSSPTSYHPTTVPPRNPELQVTTKPRPISAYVSPITRSTSETSIPATNRSALRCAEYGSLPSSFKSPPAFASLSQSSARPRPQSFAGPSTPPPASSSLSSSPAKSTATAKPQFSPLCPQSRPTPRDASTAAEAAASREARFYLIQLLREGPEAVLSSSAKGSPALSVQAKKGLASTLVGISATSPLANARSPALGGRKSAGALKWTSSFGALRKRSASGSASGSGSNSLKSRRERDLDRLRDAEERRSRTEYGLGPTTSMTIAPPPPLTASPLASSTAQSAPASPPAKLKRRPTTISRSHSLQDASTQAADATQAAWEMVEEGRPASTYSAYGSRWMRQEGGGGGGEGEMTMAGSSLYRSRTGTRSEGGGAGGDGEDEKRVWSKWRGWVREKREVA